MTALTAPRVLRLRLGLLLSWPFFIARIVALFSHSDSLARSPSSPSAGAMSGRSSGTFGDVGSPLRKPRRCDSRLVVFVLDLSLDCDDAEGLRECLTERRLLDDSSFSIENGPFLYESADEKLGGLITSWVCVSVLRKVNTGASSAQLRCGPGAMGASPSWTLSFFLSMSRNGMVYIV